MTYTGCDEMRQSAGGYGYHAASGLVTGFTDCAPFNTFEGVNVVMFQQSARYIFKMLQKLQSGGKMTGVFSYLNNMKALLTSKSAAKSAQDVTLDYIERVLQIRSLHQMELTATLHAESKVSANEKTNDLFAPEVHKMSRFHIIYVLFSFAKQLMDEYKFKDPNVKNIVEVMIKVYALKYITQDTQGLYECGFFSKGSGRVIDSALDENLIILRPQMLSIVES